MKLLQSIPTALGFRKFDMSKKVPWTAKDEATLRRVYPTGGKHGAHKEMPYRSVASIVHKVYKLKIYRTNGSGNRATVAAYAPWSLDEERVIAERYVPFGLAHVQEVITWRSAAAIRAKAHSMGLMRNAVRKKLYEAGPIEEEPATELDNPVVVWVKAENAPRPVTTAPRSIFEMVPA